jgi:pimeloyl-ACP methyl ester carboxylesterase
MATALPLLFALYLARPPVVESVFAELAPVHGRGQLVRSPGQTRAVVLIHGFLIRFSTNSVPHAALHMWQKPDSVVVRELARDADVFAFAYGQDRSVEQVAACCGLDRAVRRLRQLGYREVALVGHSAGGLIAREFVEDHPDAGVTKVIQVCCPNGGTPTAHFQAPKNQQAFLNGLSPEGRALCLRQRANRRIPPQVQFVCVVGIGEGRDTDGVVPCACQWTPDLQKQGIPAVAVPVTHWQSMRSLRGAEAIAALVREDQPRWDPGRVRTVRKAILGD